jgi:hypothetical protein
MPKTLLYVGVLCAEDGCGDDAVARGLCKRHYGQAWREGTIKIKSPWQPKPRSPKHAPPRPLAVPDERCYRIEVLRRQGMTYREIGAQFGISHERVRQLLKKFWPELCGNPVHPICEVEGCDRPTVVLADTLCGPHRHKLDKYGDVNWERPPPVIRNERGRLKQGEHYLHRKVYLAKDPGPVHSCHWCEREVYSNTDRYDHDRMIVVHLDMDAFNNVEENLVGACRTCASRHIRKVKKWGPEGPR